MHSYIKVSNKLKYPKDPPILDESKEVEYISKGDRVIAWGCNIPTVRGIIVDFCEEKHNVFIRQDNGEVLPVSLLEGLKKETAADFEINFDGSLSEFNIDSVCKKRLLNSPYALEQYIVSLERQVAKETL